MSDNKVHAVFDGIEEEDNHLPNWWLATLFLAMVFAFGYWFLYHSTVWLDTPAREYAKEAEAQKKRLALQNPMSDESLAALANDPRAVEEGKKTFTTICVACHKADGSGSVGPNLTDRYWLHGNKPTDLYGAVMTGFQDKGMPPWGPQLGEKRTREVVAFVLSIRNSEVPGGKAPQGDLKE
ncbi:MAG: c-type cytochrome [Myxococcaceae bacterium]|nr:c-type cytochrome [Myxococcaceae bacterium]